MMIKFRIFGSNSEVVQLLRSRSGRIEIKLSSDPHTYDFKVLGKYLQRIGSAAEPAPTR